MSQDAKDNLPVIEDLPKVVGAKNATKFTPHVVQLRTGALTTWSDLAGFYKFIEDQNLETQFGVAVDDRTHEDHSVAK